MAMWQIHPKLFHIYYQPCHVIFFYHCDQTDTANINATEFFWSSICVESSLNFRMIYCRSRGTSMKNYRMLENTSIPVSPKFPVFCYLILA